jgi:hypothetical protein
MTDDDPPIGARPISRVGLVVSLLAGFGVFALGVWLAIGVIASAAVATGVSAVVAYVIWPRLFRVHS